MPFYQITITLKNKEVISGVRETENLHIDPVYMEYFIKANQHYHHENIMVVPMCIDRCRSSDLFVLAIHPLQLIPLVGMLLQLVHRYSTSFRHCITSLS